MSKLELKGISMELDPGEAWDDPITFHLTREEATAILAVLVHELENNREGLRAATIALLRDENNTDALLAGFAINHSIATMQDLLVKLTKVVKPKLAEEAANG